jgi:hypothetical protein
MGEETLRGTGRAAIRLSICDMRRCSSLLNWSARLRSFEWNSGLLRFEASSIVQQPAEACEP